MRTSRPWTQTDDDTIAATMRQTAGEVAATLGRTVHAVEQRRSRLFARGVVTERGQHPAILNRTWTPDEDAIVIATVDRPTAEVMTLIPGHTRDAIKSRRRTLRDRGQLTR